MKSTPVRKPENDIMLAPGNAALILIVMKIGIIGTGGIGQALASHIAKAGYEIIVSNSRGPESLAALVTVSDILGKLGFATIDLGGLASGGRLQQFPGGSLPTLNLIKLD